MKICISTLAVIALAFAFGCETRSSSRAHERDVSAMTDEQLAEASIVFMADLVAAGQQHPRDCSQMARAMMRVVDANAELVAAMSAYRGDAAKSKWFEEHYRDRIQDSSLWLAGALSHCADSPAMRKLQDKMK